MCARVIFVSVCAHACTIPNARCHAELRGADYHLRGVDHADHEAPRTHQVPFRSNRTHIVLSVSSPFERRTLFRNYIGLKPILSALEHASLDLFNLIKRKE